MFKKSKDKLKGSGLTPGARVGLEVGPEGVSVALVDMDEKKGPSLIASEYIAESDPLKQRAMLLNWSSQYAKRGLPCIVSLHPTDYQLLLVESPNVPPKELHNAMRWRLQDLLNYPVDSASYDLFSVPEDAYRGRIAMAYVAVAPSAGIKKILSMAEKNGLQPSYVTIRELSYRNLQLNRLEESSNVLSLWLDNYGGTITLIGGNQIYFSRRLELDGAGWQVSSLAQELERSVGYAVNQLGRTKVDGVELIYANSAAESMVEQLNEALDLPVTLFSVSGAYTEDQKKSDKKKNPKDSKDEKDKREGAFVLDQLAAIGAAIYPSGES